MSNWTRPELRVLAGLYLQNERSFVARRCLQRFLTGEIMKLLTRSQREQLLANGRNRDRDHPPVVKFFNPGGMGTWLFSELSGDGDTLFGLADLGEPELGCSSLSEMASVRLRFGLGIERDLHFRPKHPLSVYARAARAAGRIVESGPELEAAANRRNAAADA